MIRYTIKIMFRCGTIVMREYYSFNSDQLSDIVLNELRGLPVISTSIVSEVSMMPKVGNVYFVNFKNNKAA